MYRHVLQMTIQPSQDELEQLFWHKYGTDVKLGWSPQLRRQFGYFTPDEVYEAIVSKLVTPDTAWLDVGSGRDLFPSNPRTARLLSERCRILVGVDPSDNIDQNHFVHRYSKCSIETFRTELTFDLITLRMVAEHITSPGAAASAISTLLNRNGRVVIYTVNKYSPVSILSAATPFKLHHRLKQLVWDGEQQDTFPVAYRMNTRSSLRRLFEMNAMSEESFAYLDDCRTLARWRVLNSVELRLLQILRRFSLHYPETCILGVYQKR